MTNLKSDPEPPPYYPPSISQLILALFHTGPSGVLNELDTLCQTLGHEVIVEADWQRLLGQYGEQKNPGIVHAVSDIIYAWCIELRLILMNAKNDDWLNELLTRVIEGGGKLRVTADVWDSTKVGTSWSDERKGFVVHLPKHFLFVRRACGRETSVLRNDFKECFQSCNFQSCNFQATEEEKEDSKPKLGKQTGTATELASGLEQLGMRDDNLGGKGPTSTAGTVVTSDIIAYSKTTTNTTSSSTEPTPNSTPFPTLDSVPSLPELCSMPPYHLTIAEETSGWISIRGSHGPSIRFIDLYISKWTPDVVMNSEDTPPIEGRPLVSGTVAGTLNSPMNTLAISKGVHLARSERPLSMTVPMVLAIVQSTLRYEVVWQGSGEYRLKRDVPFEM